MSLSNVLKVYREKYHLTQVQLAENLNVDERTLRRWENQETILKDIGELRRIASVLGVEPENLGVSEKLAGITDEQAEETLQHIWTLVVNGRAYEARAIAERLVHDLETRSVHPGSQGHLYKLTQAYHAEAYTRAMNTRNNEIRYPLASYGAMERNARLIENTTLLTVALTYEGDMHNRVGDVKKGIEYLETALQTAPREDIAARGNTIQLLARGYLKAGQVEMFERLMKEAEELGGRLTGSGVTKGQYGLKSVYEEYGKSYALMGKMQKALDYIQKARQVPPYDQHWEIVLKTTEVMALVRGGEIQKGIELAVECTELCRSFGTIRLLERIYGVQNYLQKLSRDINASTDILRDALNGPSEY